MSGCEVPRSLRGAEDAAVVWGLITERFPNAAPLLCEMETVIDRAEDLLRQLRQPREIETSTSCCTPDFEETGSFTSAQELNDKNDDVNENGKSITAMEISESTIDETEIDGDYQSRNQCSVSRDQEYLGDRSSDSSAVEYSIAEVNTNFENSIPSKAAYSRQTTKETNSLEKWEKVVDTVMHESLMTDVENIDLLCKRSDELIHSDDKCTENEENQMEEDNDESNNDLCYQGTQVDVGDSNIDIDYNANVRNADECKRDTIDLTLQGNGDESSPRFVGRTPLNILEEYAKRCKTSVVYEYITDGLHRHKSNVYVIRGNLGGFGATSRGRSEDSAKNGVAIEILRNVADKQMNDKKLGTLVDLTKQEMLEIIELGMDNTQETSQRKLYKICLENGELLPKYSIIRKKTYQGITHHATCTALGFTGEGHGTGESLAKKTAADNVYQQYCQDKTRSKFKVFYSKFAMDSWYWYERSFAVLFVVIAITIHASSCIRAGRAYRRRGRAYR